MLMVSNYIIPSSLAFYWTIISDLLHLETFQTHKLLNVFIYVFINSIVQSL